MRPAPMEGRGPLIAASSAAMKLGDHGRPGRRTRVMRRIITAASSGKAPFAAGLQGERPASKQSFDPKLKSPRQFRRVLPVDAVVLSDIKMQVFDLILSTCPNRLPRQTNCKSRFEVDVLPMIREVRDQERRSPYFSDDLVIDLVCVFLVLDKHRCKASSLYGWLDALLVNFFHFLGKRHCDKRLRRGCPLRP